MSLPRGENSAFCWAPAPCPASAEQGMQVWSAEFGRSTLKSKSVDMEIIPLLALCVFEDCKKPQKASQTCFYIKPDHNNFRCSWNLSWRICWYCFYLFEAAFFQKCCSQKALSRNVKQKINFLRSPWEILEVTNYKSHNNFCLEGFWQEGNEKRGASVSTESYSNSFLQTKPINCENQK